MIQPVLVAGPVYEQFRRGASRITAAGFELHRMHFESERAANRTAAVDALNPVGAIGAIGAAGAAGAAGNWPENERFVYPLFVPEHVPGQAPFRELLIILNGLNDSSYRKFFPWAASIARAGLPVAIFPSAFLLNRRPREWITPTATERAWQARMQVAPDSASLINAVLSQRVAADPRALLNDTLRTGADVRQLAAAVYAGQLGRDADGTALFQPRARCHLLGYSLGGYLGLALRLQDALFEASQLIMLCAGASIYGAQHERLDPISPFILDAHAAAAVVAEVSALRENAGQLGPLAPLLVELFTGASAETRQRIDRLASELTVIAGASDRIVPAAGIAANLGRLDAVLPLGIHEYPFNLTTSDGARVSREIARSHQIAPAFEQRFGEFLELVLKRVGGLPRRQPVNAAALAVDHSGADH